MSKVIFLSFATRNMAPTLKRIRKEAEESGFFDEIHTCDERILKKDKKYWKQYKQWYENNPRGYGYWLWKPYLILRELNNLEDRDVLVYLDAGCIINAMGRSRYMQYINMLSDEEPIICFDHKNCFAKQYCKAGLLKYFNLLENKQFLDSKQMMAGLLIIRKCRKSLEFIQEWHNVGHNSLSLINDSPSALPEHQEFREHRHDQSVFSCLCWKYDIKGLPQQEVYPIPCDWSTMADFPFWAVRRKEFSVPTLIERIVRKLMRFVRK